MPEGVGYPGDDGFSQLAQEFFPELAQEAPNALPGEIEAGESDPGFDPNQPEEPANPLVEGLTAMEPAILDATPEQKLEALRFLLR